VIRERGLEHVRVADVADRAGTSAPSVLYYFASKAELLKEALVARARSDDRWQIGDRVRLGWHREHARVLR
jgi:AcrR family transcriptional regulator